MDAVTQHAHSYDNRRDLILALRKLRRFSATVMATARDAHGPLAFLDWPRCFADTATPSRFLVYCRP